MTSGLLVTILTVALLGCRGPTTSHPGPPEPPPVPDCNGIEQPLVFAGLEWGSARLHNHIAGTILQAGFGCQHTNTPGLIVPTMQGLVRGDIDITMEIWVATAPDFYHDAVAAGDVLDLGLNVRASEMSFLVPRYVIEGDPERGIEPMAPDLKSVMDLPRYAQVFQDPDQPDKGRYHNCPVAWACEMINTMKLAAYGIEEHFANFRPNGSSALEASIASAYQKGEAWLGYYWGPTPLLGLYDMVPLEEPEWTQECWDGDRGCAFRPVMVNVAVSKGFADRASEEMMAFLRSYGMDRMLVSAYLAHQSTTDAEWAEVARHFLATETDVWTAWVSEEVAGRVRAELN